MQARIRRYFEHVHRVTAGAEASDAEGRRQELAAAFAAVAALARQAHDQGCKLMFIGNGAGAGIASHLATDFTKDGDRGGGRIARRSMSSKLWHVMVTGGAGYVGSRLVPKLLEAGHQVTVLDLYLYGDVFHDIARHPNLRQVKGDLRRPEVVADAL